HWVGELSSSSLSTATAVVALATVARKEDAGLIGGGLRWLAAHQNPDGGWGDTVRSKSNISTTALCWAAFGAVSKDEEFGEVVACATAWLAAATGRDGTPCRPHGVPSLPVAALCGAIARRYGKDRTFSVPILMTLALSGRIEW